MGKTLNKVKEVSKDVTVLSGLAALGLGFVGAETAASLVANFLTVPGAIVWGTTSIANSGNKQLKQAA